MDMKSRSDGLYPQAFDKQVVIEFTLVEWQALEYDGPATSANHYNPRPVLKLVSTYQDAKRYDSANNKSFP